MAPRALASFLRRLEVCGTRIGMPTFGVGQMAVASWFARRVAIGLSTDLARMVLDGCDMERRRILP